MQKLRNPVGWFVSCEIEDNSTDEKITNNAIQKKQEKLFVRHFHLFHLHKVITPFLLR